MNGKRPRPAAVTIAGLLMLIFGSLVGLLGLLCVAAGAAIPALRQAPEFGDSLASVPAGFEMVAVAMGIVLLTWGVTQAVAGVFVMRRRTWARIAGIVVGILGALAGLAGSLPATVDANPVGPIIFAVFGGAHVYAIWVLIRSAEWFAAVEQAPA